MLQETELAFAPESQILTATVNTFSASQGLWTADKPSTGSRNELGLAQHLTEGSDSLTLSGVFGYIQLQSRATNAAPRA